MLTPFGPFAGPNLSVGVDTSSKGERQGEAFVTGARCIPKVGLDEVRLSAR